MENAKSQKRQKVPVGFYVLRLVYLLYIFFVYILMISKMAQRRNICSNLNIIFKKYVLKLKTIGKKCHGILPNIFVIIILYIVLN